MGELRNRRGGHFSIDFMPEPEYRACMPTQFFVRAMHANTGFFLTNEFITEANKVDSESLVEYLISDLETENDSDPNPILMLYYLFTDFKDEFPRLMMMNRKKNSDQS
jgi:hypothetical protein